MELHSRFDMTFLMLYVSFHAFISSGSLGSDLGFIGFEHLQF